MIPRAIQVVGRRKWRLVRRLARHRLTATALKTIGIYNRGQRLVTNTLNLSAKFLGSLIGAALAIGFSLSADGADNLASLKASEVHLAGAAIIGTGLALLLSLSIIPAQKAADLFSPAILSLYAKDRAALLCFSSLVVAVLLSIFMGANLSFGWPSFINVSAQFFLLGFSLDVLRIYYFRTLQLLLPSTAMGLVLKDCGRRVDQMTRGVERTIRVSRLLGLPMARKSPNDLRRILMPRVSPTSSLQQWVSELAELAHKGITRHDLSSSTGAIETIGGITQLIVKARRESVLFFPHPDQLLATTSDLSPYLSHVYEKIRLVSDHAIRQKIEHTAIDCLRVLGNIAVETITVVKSQARPTTAPLCYSAIFYVEQCSDQALRADMDDALLQAMRSIDRFFENIQADISISDAATEARNCLWKMTVARYNNPRSIIPHRALSSLLRSAYREMDVQGFDEVGAFSEVLRKIALLVQLEVQREQTLGVNMEVFPPYSMTNEASLPYLLNLVASACPPHDPAKRWVNPFGGFLKASEQLVMHYREVAKTTDFKQTNLLGWTLRSAFRAADIHLGLISGPDQPFAESVIKKLSWFLALPPFFFDPSPLFPSRLAGEASGELAILAMKLIEKGFGDAAIACVGSIESIAQSCAQSEKSRAYEYADIAIKLEHIARAAESRRLNGMAENTRRRIRKPDHVSDEKWVDFKEAFSTRSEQMDEALDRFDHHYGMPGDSESYLKQLLERRA